MYSLSTQVMERQPQILRTEGSSNLFESRKSHSSFYKPYEYSCIATSLNNNSAHLTYVNINKFPAHYYRTLVLISYWVIIQLCSANLLPL